MTLSEMVQITVWLTGIAIYWWALGVALILAITRYMAEKVLAKMDRKIVPIRTMGVY